VTGVPVSADQVWMLAARAKALPYPKTPHARR
jgi:hypothetical protein